MSETSLAHLAASIQREHELCAAAIERGCEHAINAGRLLLEAKAQLKHGRWLPWLRDNCQIATRTAQVYMQLTRLAPNAQRVADLPLRRAALELQRQDRDARQRAEREQVSQQLPPAPSAGTAIAPVPVEVVFDEAAAADDLIDQLLLAASEVDVSMEALFEAFRRRLEPMMAPTDEARVLPRTFAGAESTQ
jgi:Protein of unknown function (DUF3102)